MRKSDDVTNTRTNLPISLLLYGIFGVLISLLLLLISAFTISSGIVPESASNAAPVAAAFVGAFISGFACTRHMKNRVLLMGLIQGFVCMILLYITGGMVFSRMMSANTNWYVFLACIVGGILGGIINASRKRRRI